MDDEIVQKDSASEGEESKPEPTLAETVQAVVDKAVLGMESRMKQSARDTARFEASKTKPDDVVSAAVREALGGKMLEGGESVSSYLDAAERDAELNRYRTAEKQTVEEQRRATESAQVYYNFLETSGIGREDPRLDWASDEQDPKKALDRWYASIAKIKGEPVKEVKADAPKAEDTENFVDTAQTVSVKAFSIPTKKADFGPWLDKLPYSVYKEHKEEIEAAHNSGQMK